MRSSPGGFIALAVAAVLLVPSTSWSHGSKASTSSLTGTIKIFTGGIDVSVTNNGPDGTNWVWIRMVSSVHHTGATMDGGGCGPGGDSNTVRCGIAAPGFVPGSTHVVHIMTDAPYPPNGGAQLFTSDLFSGPPVPAGTATGPAPATTPPPPPPPPRPCECKNVKASTYGWGDFQDSTGPRTDFAFRLKWSMNCGGAAGNCKGEIDIVPPAGLKITTPKTLKFSCAGKCRPGEGITLNRNAKPIPVRGTSAAALDKDARGGKSFTFRFQSYCIRNGNRLRSARSTMTITYRPNGLIDTRASDLNGDGKPDRK